MARADRIQEVLIFVLLSRLERSVLFCGRREVLRISGVFSGVILVQDQKAPTLCEV